MALLLSGKDVANSYSENISKKVDALKARGIFPALCIIRVGENPGDISYERGAAKRCENVGIEVKHIALPTDVTTGRMLQLMDEMNADDSVHGVLLLRPLPKHIDAEAVENRLKPEKDVDCMTDLSLGAVFTGKRVGFYPCTPQAVLAILDHYGIDCTGKRAVVIGRSNVFGKPAAMMLMSRNATVTICHTKTVDLPSVARQADILITAAGCAKSVGAECVREGQIVIDVGINMDENGKLCGDVDFDAVSDIVEMITPVPGGVGSVTSSILAGHVAEAAEAAEAEEVAEAAEAAEATETAKAAESSLK